MAITVEFGGGPPGALGRDAREGFEQRLFRFAEAFKGWGTGGAVDAVTGNAQCPVHQLLVGIDEVTELTQR